MNTLRYSKTDSRLVFFFVLSLLFSGSNVYALAYPILKVGVVLGYFCIFYRTPFSANHFRSNIAVQFSLLLIFVWLIFAILSSMVQASVDMISLSFRYTAYLFVFLLISFSKKDMSHLFYKWYCKIFYVIALSSFISFMLNILNITPMVELVSQGERVYFSTFFNIVMSDSVVTLNGFSFYRFQSIFEEPGTFAFLLLPVIYWYRTVEYNRFKFISLMFMLLWTLSIGAMFTAIITLFLYSAIKHRLYSIPIFVSFVVIFILSLGLFPEFQNFLAYKFGVGKFEGQHSSFGARILEISYVSETLSSRLLGVGFSGANILSVFGNSVSVGLFRQVIYSGAIGGVAIIALNLFLGIYSIKSMRSTNNRSIFIGFTLLTFIFMGLQRSTFIDGFMAVTLFSFLLRFNVFEK
jgi:hypothetical protein